MSDLSFVRVLDLEGYGGPIRLDGLNKLLLLRYLGLRGTGISELPASVWELRCLETLDVRSTNVKELPRSIGRLRETLTTLLFSSEGMLNSRTGTKTSIAEDVQHCRELVNLATIDLREHHASFVKSLGALDSLRMITIIWSLQHCTDESYREALLSCIQKWTNLRSLTIHCGLSCSMEFLGSLSHPPELLEKFMVTDGGSASQDSVPYGIGNLQRLTEVAKHRNPINLTINNTKVDVQEEVVEETKMTTIIQSGDVQQDGEVIARTRIETWGEIEIEPEGDNINDA
nr:unnamed protein product [Digitaria exilis]